MVEVTITHSDGSTSTQETNIKKREASRNERNKKALEKSKKESEELNKELSKYKKNEKDIIIKRASGNIERQRAGVTKQVITQQQQDIQARLNKQAELKTSTQDKQTPNFRRDYETTETEAYNIEAQTKTSNQDLNKANFLKQNRKAPKTTYKVSDVIDSKTYMALEPEKYKEAVGLKLTDAEAEAQFRKTIPSTLTESETPSKVDKLLYQLDTSESIIDRNLAGAGLFALGVGKGVKDVVILPYTVGKEVVKNPMLLTPMGQTKAIIGTVKNAPSIVKELGKELNKNPTGFIGEVAGNVGTGIVVSKLAGSIIARSNKINPNSYKYVETTSSKLDDFGSTTEFGTAKTIGGKDLKIETTLKTYKDTPTTFETKVFDSSGKLKYTQVGEVGVPKNPTSYSKIKIQEGEKFIFNIGDEVAEVTTNPSIITETPKKNTFAPDSYKTVTNKKVNINKIEVDLIQPSSTGKELIKFGDDLKIKGVTTEVTSQTSLVKESNPLNLISVDKTKVPYYSESELIFKSSDKVTSSKISSRINKLTTGDDVVTKITSETINPSKTNIVTFTETETNTILGKSQINKIDLNLGVTSTEKIGVDLFGKDLRLKTDVIVSQTEKINFGTKIESTTKNLFQERFTNVDTVNVVKAQAQLDLVLGSKQNILVNPLTSSKIDFSQPLRNINSLTKGTIGEVGFTNIGKIPLSSSKLSPISLLALNIKSNQGQRIENRTLTDSKTKTNIVEKPEEIVTNREDTILDNTTIIKTKIKPITITDTKLTEEVITETIIEPIIQKEPIIIAPTQSTPFSPIGLILPTPDKEKKKEKKKKGFDVFVRKKGVFIKSNIGSLSKGDALDLGASIVSSTARASFKLVSSGASLSGLKSKSKGAFQRNKSNFNLKNNIFIEKRSKRIKSGGEKAEITLQGIKANRIKGMKIKGFKI